MRGHVHKDGAAVSDTLQEASLEEQGAAPGRETGRPMSDSHLCTNSPYNCEGN